tara:strand:+ start:722 stop:910 length:189 start_codon:yes stop_codon:yes gene_type:complete
MSSTVSLSPVEDCQLYQKRILFKEENGEVKQVRIITHKKENDFKRESNRKDKWCKLCGSKMN